MCKSLIACALLCLWSVASFAAPLLTEGCEAQDKQRTLFDMGGDE